MLDKDRLKWMFSCFLTGYLFVMRKLSFNAVTFESRKFELQATGIHCLGFSVPRCLLSEGKTIFSNIQEIAEANCRLTVSEISGRLRAIEFMPAITCTYSGTNTAHIMHTARLNCFESG